MGLKKFDYSATELLSAVTIDPQTGRNYVSFGQALKQLADLVELGDEYQGDCTGLDALVYHLDGYTVDRAIKALERVRDHFKVC